MQWNTATFGGTQQLTAVARDGAGNMATSTAALVGVASSEVPSLQRVNAGDPAGSYLIHKLEGTQSVGQRMPLGGPFLDSATIDQVRAWIQAGAAP